MKPLLVYPRYKYATMITTDEPLGILYIGAVVEKAGFRPTFNDLTFAKSLDSMLEAAKRSDCIAFSASTQLFRRTCEIMEKVRTVNPSIRSIIGGPHATAFVEDALAAFDIAVWEDLHKALFKPVTGKQVQVGERLLLGERNIYIDFVEPFGYIGDGEFSKVVHHLPFDPGGSGYFRPDYPISFFLKPFLNGYNNTSFILPWAR